MNLTVFPKHCFDDEYFCLQNFAESANTKNYGRKELLACVPRTLDVHKSTSYSFFWPIESKSEPTEMYLVLTAEKTAVCDWGLSLSQARAKFLAYGISTCTVPVVIYPYPGISPTLPYLALLLLPFIILLLVLKKIRDAYRQRLDAQSVTVENPSDNSIPMYDMSQINGSQNDQVQIFPEYPMMYANQQGQPPVVNYDTTQSLTPVYTQTYSHPGIH